MKKLIFIFSLFSLHNILLAQIILTTQRIFEEVVKVDSTSKTVLCNRALLLMSQLDKESSDSFLTTDSITCELVGKAEINYEIIVKGNGADYSSITDRRIITNVLVTISIQLLCKESRYKYKIQVEDIKRKKGNHAAAKSETTIKKIDNEIDKTNLAQINMIIQNIREYMIRPLGNEFKDW